MSISLSPPPLHPKTADTPPSFFVETAGKTLEELKDIFEAKNPRKASTKKVKVAVDPSGRVLEVGDEVASKV